MNILIFGATSAIAQAVAMRYASAGNRFVLVARDERKLAALRARLIESGADEVELLVADLAVFPKASGATTDQAADQTKSQSRGAHLNALIDKAFASLPSVDLALVCHGTLPNQADCEQSFDASFAALDINGLSAVALLTAMAPKMAAQRRGTIAVITSVAGDRGRRSNYVYGSAKALVSACLQGLRGRLHGAGVHVVDIRPGLVDSPMTAHLAKGPLFASPRRVADGIVRAIARKRHTVYVPSWWRLIMAVVRALPDAIFKRLKI